MEAEDFEARSHAHMTEQVRHAGVVQAALSRYWDAMIDPDDFAATFERFREVALPLVQAGRSISEADAERYYREIMAAAELEASVLLPRTPRPDAAIRASLSAGAGAQYTDYRLRQGADAARTVAAAKSGMLGSAKRQMLNAGRSRLVSIANSDPNVLGWARQSDGAPCPFCAMLVSRGPVYSAATAGFRAHDRCGCSARLVPINDPSGGWSAEAREYRKLWDENKGDPDEFRRAIEQKRTGATAAPHAAPPAKPATRGLADEIADLKTPAAVQAAAQARHPGIQWSGFDGRGIDLDLTKDAVGQVSALLDRFPAVKLTEIKAVTIRNNGVMAQVRTPYARDEAGHRIFTDGRPLLDVPGMEISAGYLRNPTRLADAIRQSNAGGHFHDVEEHMAHVVTHEFGHALDSNLQGKLVQAFVALRKEMAPTNGKEMLAWNKENLSGYGRTSPTEGVAEAFADAVMKGDDALPFSKAFYATLLRIYEEEYGHAPS
jgi:hypothetical protein